MSEKDLMELILHKVTGMEGSISEIKQDVSGLKQDVSGLKQDVSGLKQDVFSLNDRMTCLENSVAETNRKVDILTVHVEGANEKIKNVQLALENEIHFSIAAVADGHFDISRKIDEVIKMQAINEKLVVDVNHLKIEVKDIQTDNKLLNKKMGLLLNPEKQIQDFPQLGL